MPFIDFDSYSVWWRTDVAAGLLLLYVIRSILKRATRVKTTKLNGPKSDSWLFGLFPTLVKSTNPGVLIDQWASDHGKAFSIPMPLGSRNVFLCDVKAAIHFFARDTFTYQQTKLSANFIKNMFGRGILWAEEEDHRRQRKALTPAFSNAALRGYLNVFYDSVYKMKSVWEGQLDAGNAAIEVQGWMNSVALDNLGIAGFGYNFGALDGNKPSVVNVFEAFESPEKANFVSRMFFFMAPFFPILLELPTSTNRMLKSIKTSMKVIADDLMLRMKAEMSMVEDKHTEKSIIGLLIKAESASAGLTMSREEVEAQMATLLFAGYETTSVSLTWALIELSKNVEAQEKLREELSQFQGSDPTFDQLTHSLPYLNAVTQETLRLHPPLLNINRRAMEDDIVPLGAPITTASGEVVSELVIAKGTSVQCSIHHINQSEELWGPDAKQFKPDRWLSELKEGAKAIQGHHHVLSFADGPRFCLGRNFALVNFKATLSVMIRNFAFELPEGPETVIGRHKGVLPRPKIEGEEGPKVPLKVRKLE